MTYDQLKKQQDAKSNLMRKEMEREADIAYNEGLWASVKWNPFKWWVFIVFKR